MHNKIPTLSSVKEEPTT